MLGVLQSRSQADGHWPTLEAAMFVMTSVARHVDVYVDHHDTSSSVSSVAVQFSRPDTHLPPPTQTSGVDLS